MITASVVADTMIVKSQNEFPPSHAPMNNPLRYKHWLLKHEMSSLHEIGCFICSFLKALLMDECLKNELYS